MLATEEKFFSNTLIWLAAPSSQYEEGYTYIEM